MAVTSAAIAELSTPDDSDVPTGTSDRSRSCTDLVSWAPNRSAQALGVDSRPTFSTASPRIPIAISLLSAAVIDPDRRSWRDLLHVAEPGQNPSYGRPVVMKRAAA